MNAAQKEVVDYLLQNNYEMVRESVWPELRHKVSGKLVMVAFDGRQVDRGWSP